MAVENITYYPPLIPPKSDYLTNYMSRHWDNFLTAFYFSARSNKFDEGLFKEAIDHLAVILPHDTSTMAFILTQDDNLQVIVNHENHNAQAGLKEISDYIVGNVNNPKKIFLLQVHSVNGVINFSDEELTALSEIGGNLGRAFSSLKALGAGICIPTIEKSSKVIQALPHEFSEELTEWIFPKNDRRLS